MTRYDALMTTCTYLSIVALPIAYSDILMDRGCELVARLLTPIESTYKKAAQV
ncbi:hypothetical protein GCM10009129_03960 [Psychrobacter aestuarii]|uniref:Uncharacterized protein n=1 Tax=Psychrobacter aestuarii TaxID=556327 RepID=A0ABP3F856_9GAMM